MLPAVRALTPAPDRSKHVFGHVDTEHRGQTRQCRLGGSCPIEVHGYPPGHGPQTVAFSATGAAVPVPSASAFSRSYSLALIAPESSRAFAEAIWSVAVAVCPSGAATRRM